MMHEIGELYQQVILDHYRNPRNAGRLEAFTHEAEGINPLCGDEVRVQAVIRGDLVESVRHQSSGCAICVASASIMSEEATARTTTSVFALISSFVSFVRGEADATPEGKLAVFGGVAQFPMRVKCATLAWHTLEEAIRRQR